MMQASNYPTISTRTALRPTVLEIDLEQISSNYTAIRKQVGQTIVMPIVKANAYGHGLVRVGQHLQKIGATMLGVAFLEEGILLREAGVTLPILVLGGILGSQVPLFLEHDLTITASSVVKLEHIEEAAKKMGIKAKVHLKIDTGMERIGVHYYSAESLLEASLSSKHIHIEGIFSHFANSDSSDLSSARMQLERFDEVTSFFEKRSVATPLRHMANSGAILQLPKAWMDIVRPGIMLYGVYPASAVEKSIEINPALSWTSRLVYFKVVRANHPVSYGSTWKSKKDTRVVTVPVGYGDGYFRSMSGTAHVLIGKKGYPVVGTITMDQIMVDIGQDSAFNNDEIVLIGKMGDQEITVQDLADWASTIPYEILTNINTRVPRIYKQDQ